MKEKRITPIAVLRQKRKEAALALQEKEVGTAEERALTKAIEGYTELIGRIIREQGKGEKSPSQITSSPKFRSVV